MSTPLSICYTETLRTSVCRQSKKKAFCLEQAVLNYKPELKALHHPPGPSAPYVLSTPEGQLMYLHDR